MGADQFAGEAMCGQPFVQIIADRLIILTRWIERRDLDQLLRERDQVVALCVNAGCQRVREMGFHAPSLTSAPALRQG